MSKDLLIPGQMKGFFGVACPKKLQGANQWNLYFILVFQIKNSIAILVGKLDPYCKGIG